MVVAIIAVLATLSIAVMAGITDQAKGEATNATLLKVNRLLEQRIEAFDRAYKGEREDRYIRATVRELKTPISNGGAGARFDYFANNPSEAPQELKALARKAGFRYEFPQRMVELTVFAHDPTINPLSLAPGVAPGDLNSDGIPDIIHQKLLTPLARQQLIAEGEDPNAAGFRALVLSRISANWAKHIAHETLVRNATGGLSGSASSDSLHSTESAELLYFILTKSGTFGTSPTDSDQFTSNEVLDTDGDSMPEFVDAWDQPLRFYRWPTRLVDPDAPSPFLPDFDTPGDPTEVDLTPTDDDGDTSTIEDTDALREVLLIERELAEVLFRGLPPSPTPIGASTPRDVMLIDPDDPVGFLYSFLENKALKAQGVVIANEFNEAKYHTPDTYHTPLIVSAGSDGLLGLREPNDVDGANGVFGNLAQYAGTRATPTTVTPSSAVIDSIFDNRTNRNKRAGGR